MNQERQKLQVWKENEMKEISFKFQKLQKGAILEVNFEDLSTSKLENRIIQFEKSLPIMKETLSMKKKKDEKECSICMDRPKSHALAPCGHVFCEECSGLVQNCPVCRAKKTSILKIYSD